MSPPLQTVHDAGEAAETSGVAPSGSNGATGLAGDDEVVSIELNFNAFADNCPPDRHARRVPRYGDPSVQDFADQALELAALRAELKRLTRDHEGLQNQLRARDARLEMMREELARLRAVLKRAKRGQAEAPECAEAAEAPSETTTVSGAAAAAEARPSYDGASTLVIAARPETSTADEKTGGDPNAPCLIPIDSDGDSIVLQRAIVTVGRTRRNDLCIPSPAISRDHARLLVTKAGVTLIDLDSANGCFVNDARVKRRKLRDGDVLRFGDRSYRFAHDCGRKDASGDAQAAGT